MFFIISAGILNCELPSKEDLRAEVESERNIMRNSSGARIPEGLWPVPGFEDTEFGVFMEPGGVSWRDGSSRESTSLRRSS